MAASRSVNGLKIIPSPKGWPIIGTLGQLIAAGGAPKLHEYVEKRHHELGPIYREKIGPVKGVFVNNADYMRRIFSLEGKHPRHIIPESWDLFNQTYGQKRGLLFMENEEWSDFRKVLNGIFLKPDTTLLVDAGTVAADSLIATWIKDGGTQDLENQLYKWSLQSVVAILLGAEKYKEWSPKLDFAIQDLSKKLHLIMMDSAKLSLIPAKLAKTLHLPQWTKFVTTVNTSFQTAENLMDELTKIPLDSNGLLKQLQNTNMTKIDLNRIVIDLILAAGDTTAFTSQWLLYLLATHPDIQDSLYSEVKSLNYASAIQNGYIKGALRETLRLYPVAPFVTRYMPDDANIDGYLLNKGDLIIMSLYSCGRSKNNFPEPLLFLPDRWIRQERGYKAVANAQAYLPFAMGARSCIGRKIAETLITTTLTMILQNLKVEQQEKCAIDIELHLIAVPSQRIQLKMQKRN